MDQVQAFTWGVFSSIVAALTIMGVQWCADAMRARRNGFSGTWQASLYDWSTGVHDRTDEWEIRQVGDRVTADIRRTWPADQTGRRWRFKGRWIRGHLIGAFESISMEVPSDGSVLVHLSKDGRFEGKYLRYDESCACVRDMRIEIVRVSR